MFQILFYSTLYAAKTNVNISVFWLPSPYLDLITLTINEGYFPIQCSPIGLSYGDELCSLWGRYWFSIRVQPGKYPDILNISTTGHVTWCNLAASQRRPYCPSVRSQWPTERISFITTMRLPWLFFFGKTSHHAGLSAPPPLQPIFVSLRLLAFPKAKIARWKEEICECDSHTVHKLSRRRLTAFRLAPRENDCSRMHSKVSSDWLPSYIKATRQVVEIFKMFGYFPDRPRNSHRYISDITLFRAVGQAVSRRSFVTEIRVRFWGSPWVIYGGYFGTWTGFCPSTSVVPCQYHSTIATCWSP